jgi:hypothetical protein
MRKDLDEQYMRIKAKASEVCRGIGKPTMFGHAFIWGSVPVTLKNGKVKYYRGCLASVCTDDIDGCVRAVQALGVKDVYYNMD